MTELPEEKSVATLERALAILATFDGQPVQSLADIARRTGLYKSTLLRLIATLQKFGYLGQQADGAYHVGVAALHLGSLYQGWVQPAEIINPRLLDLVAETGESASFNIRDDAVRVCVYRIDSRHKIRDHTRVGDIMPIGRGAAGRILEAFDTAAETHRLATVRRECFALTRGEIEVDTAAIAAPVLGVGGRCEGALALTGPASRFTDERVGEMKLPLLRAALAISHDFGGSVGKLEAALHGAETAG